MTIKFETLTVQAVKSISQRCLLGYWNELCAGRRYPALSDFRFDSRMHDPKALMIWKTEWEGSGCKFRALHQGEWLTQALQTDWVGSYMEEIAPDSIRQYVVRTATECAVSGSAVYSVISTIDSMGHRVDCERLLLPFGNGPVVKQIVASLQLISLKGRFERTTVLNNYRSVATIELAGCISSGFAKPVVAAP